MDCERFYLYEGFDFYGYFKNGRLHFFGTFSANVSDTEFQLKFQTAVGKLAQTFSKKLYFLLVGTCGRIWEDLSVGDTLKVGSTVKYDLGEINKEEGVKFNRIYKTELLQQALDANEHRLCLEFTNHELSGNLLVHDTYRLGTLCTHLKRSGNCPPGFSVFAVVGMESYEFIRTCAEKDLEYGDCRIRCLGAIRIISDEPGPQYQEETRALVSFEGAKIELERLNVFKRFTEVIDTRDFNNFPLSIEVLKASEMLRNALKNNLNLRFRSFQTIFANPNQLLFDLWDYLWDKAYRKRTMKVEVNHEVFQVPRKSINPKTWIEGSRIRRRTFPRGTYHDYYFDETVVRLSGEDRWFDREKLNDFKDLFDHEDDESFWKQILFDTKFIKGSIVGERFLDEVIFVFARKNTMVESLKPLEIRRNELPNNFSVLDLVRQIIDALGGGDYKSGYSLFDINEDGLYEKYIEEEIEYCGLFGVGGIWGEKRRNYLPEDGSRRGWEMFKNRVFFFLKSDRSENRYFTQDFKGKRCNILLRTEELFPDSNYKNMEREVDDAWFQDFHPGEKVTVSKGAGNSCVFSEDVLMKSQMVQKMERFGGREAEEMRTGKLSLEGIKLDEFKCYMLLCWLGGGNKKVSIYIEENLSLASCINVLCSAIIYGEDWKKFQIMIYMIRQKLFCRMWNTSSKELVMMEIGHLLTGIPEEIREDIVGGVFEDVRKEKAMEEVRRLRRMEREHMIMGEIKRGGNNEELNLEDIIEKMERIRVFSSITKKMSEKDDTPPLTSTIRKRRRGDVKEKRLVEVTAPDFNHRSGKTVVEEVEKDSKKRRIMCITM